MCIRSAGVDKHGQIARCDRCIEAHQACSLRSDPKSKTAPVVLVVVPEEEEEEEEE